ncbi:MAG TPA: class I SAM-dependent methyltransferase [Prolixibacteraceae bacterium]|nr:class I SAM-dependent methyltransferase [Prolixibacteraceae bacterium]
MNLMPTTFEPSAINLYMQQALRPISRRYVYSAYVDSLPIEPHHKILEFGSGIGVMAELMAKKLSRGRLTCIDVSRRYLSRAKRNLRDYPNTTFINGKLTQLEMDTEVFDAINVHFVLHDVPAENRSSLVDEMYSLLRPGGKVFLREPLRESHGMGMNEINLLFAQAGFYRMYEREKRIRFYGDIYTTCFIKAANIQFFFS